MKADKMQKMTRYLRLTNSETNGETKVASHRNNIKMHPRMLRPWCYTKTKKKTNKNNNKNNTNSNHNNNHNDNRDNHDNNHNHNNNNENHSDNQNGNENVNHQRIKGAVWLVNLVALSVPKASTLLGNCID
ncbi:unnamed protein product [Polarella glacialis]|uniref:Uncharacterized protein n=1 Tax=Polarella glacialis TaxID=89957 RepID=A0A813FT23_POLGL|nr:unnamed protein product [Polarella glacialis]